MSEESTQKQRGNSQNLKPFQPGQSGNPGGRPKGSVSIVQKIRQHLRDNPDDVDEIVRAAIKQAKENPQGMKSLIDRIDGAVTQNVNVSQLTNEQLISLLTQGVDGGGDEAGVESSGSGE